MVKGSALSSQTERQDGREEESYAIPLNILAGADGQDARSRGNLEVEPAKRTPTAGSANPLLGKDEPAPEPDVPLSASGTSEPYPEGGIRSWLVVLGCWLALFASLGFMHILATFQAYVATNQTIRLGPAAIGGMISGYAFLSFLLGIYVGPLFDKYGPRWLVLGGTVCLVASLVLASISSEYWHLLAALGVLSSLGTSLLFTPAIASIAHFFHHRRGLAIGVATTAGSLSGVVFPFTLEALFRRVGWEWAMRALALICLAVTAAAAFLIRARLPPAPDATPHPHSKILRTKGFVPTVLAVISAQFAAFIPLSYLSSYALSKGFSQAFSVYVIAILNASSAVGRVVAGWLADRIGPFNANIGFAAIAALACFGIWLPAGGSKPGLIIFAVVIGIASGSSVSLVPVAIGRLCKTQEYGRYYGTCYAVASLVVLLAIPVADKAVGGNKGAYWVLIVTTGVFYLVAVAAFAVAKVSVVGSRIWAAF
ncbi:hypothetical protein VTI74DRAFT_5643 [Chaetomium olivicolor]